MAVATKKTPWKSTGRDRVNKGSLREIKRKVPNKITVAKKRRMITEDISMPVLYMYFPKIPNVE